MTQRRMIPRQASGRCKTEEDAEGAIEADEVETIKFEDEVSVEGIEPNED